MSSADDFCGLCMPQTSRGPARPDLSSSVIDEMYAALQRNMLQQRCIVNILWKSASSAANWEIEAYELKHECTWHTAARARVTSAVIAATTLQTSGISAMHAPSKKRLPHAPCANTTRKAHASHLT